MGRLREVEDIGVVVAGDTPDPWQPTVLDADGAPVNITGATITAVYGTNARDYQTVTGQVIDGPGGTLRVQFPAFTSPGIVEGQVFYTVGGAAKLGFDFTVQVDRASTATGVFTP